MALKEKLTRRDERIAAGKEMRLVSVREKEARLIQAMRESHDIETRLLLKGRVKEAETQQARTAELKRNQLRLQTEIREIVVIRRRQSNLACGQLDSDRSC